MGGKISLNFGLQIQSCPISPPNHSPKTKLVSANFSKYITFHLRIPLIFPHLVYMAINLRDHPVQFLMVHDENR